MNKTVRKSVAGAAVALALFSVAGPQAIAQLLKDVVIQTLETNPNVLSSVRRKDAADSAIEAAKGAYYPRLDWLWGTGREQSDNTTTRAAGATGYVHLTRKQEGMVLNQMLWDGFGTKSEVNRRQAISDSTAHKTYGTAEEIALQAIDAYLAVLKNREQVGYARDNLQAHQRTFDQVKLRADKGVGRRADLEQIAARLALAQSNMAAAESTLRDAEIAYLKVVGKPAGMLTRPAVPQNIPKTVEEAVKVGLANHPILRSALSDVEAAQAQRELARSFFSPRFEVEASYTNNKNIDGIEGPNRDRMIMVWLKWNLFRGFFDKHRMSETAYQINEASEIARNTHRQVENAVRLAYNAFATARERLPQLERYVKASDATRVAYNQQFAIGQRTLLDLLDSENEFYTARTTHLDGLFIEMSARYRILNAMGQLLTTLDVTPPEQAVVRSQ
jgi:adhesin transport system outer membrane protein